MSSRPYPKRYGAAKVDLRGLQGSNQDRKDQHPRAETHPKDRTSAPATPSNSAATCHSRVLGNIAQCAAPG